MSAYLHAGLTKQKSAIGSTDVESVTRFTFTKGPFSDPGQESKDPVLCVSKIFLLMNSQRLVLYLIMNLIYE